MSPVSPCVTMALPFSYVRRTEAVTSLCSCSSLQSANSATVFKCAIAFVFLILCSSDRHSMVPTEVSSSSVPHASGRDASGATMLSCTRAPRYAHTRTSHGSPLGLAIDAGQLRDYIAQCSVPPPQRSPPLTHTTGGEPWSPIANLKKTARLASSGQRASRPAGSCAAHPTRQAPRPATVHVGPTPPASRWK